MTSQSAQALLHSITAYFARVSARMASTSRNLHTLVETSLKQTHTFANNLHEIYDFKFNILVLMTNFTMTSVI
jgi:hypothetical protein